MLKNKSGIEEMRRKLYSRGGQEIGPKKRNQLREIEYDTKSKWAENKDSNKIIQKEKKYKKTRKSFLSTLLTASFVFFLLAIGFSSYFIFGGSNTVSSQNIDIVIEGPATVSGGEELSLQIGIVNKNSVPIKLADLLVEYPDGTRSAVDIAKALPRYRESIGTVAPGEVLQKTVKAILLGSEDTQQDIKVTIEYRVDDSNAIFFTEKIYTVTLISAPLSISVSGVDEITSGQEIDFTIDIVSNSNTIIKDALLSVEYPFGFEFISAVPEPAFTNKVWDLGDIQPEGKRIIKLRGIIIGEDNEERVFRFFGGVKSEKDEKELGVSFATLMKSIFIKKPFIGVNLALNGDQGSEYVAGIGDKIRADMVWVNNMPVRVLDAEIEVKLRSESLDRFSITTDQGFYKSLNNTIIYSRETNEDLAVLEPGESGGVTFSFASLGASSGSIFKNPEIILDISIRGKRLSEDNVPQEINSSITRTVKLASDLFLASRALYSIGPFDNTGPLPPKAEKETTYTIIWTITNSSNIVDDVKVIAVLPSYVRWTGKISPSSEDIAFNPLGGKIVWNVGSVKPKADVSNSGQKEVAFQVALLPSLSQVGDSPILINQQTINGFDRFTNTALNSVKKELTTRLVTDPNFNFSDADVVENQGTE